RRRDVVAAPPFVHLLVAPFLACVVLVEPDEIAVVALVERLVADHRDFRLPHLVENKVERALRALERRGVGDVERDALGLEPFAGGTRFLDALVGEVDVAPAGEQVFLVPLALAVANENEKALAGHQPPPDFFAASMRAPNVATSAMANARPAPMKVTTVSSTPVP